jgi:hypothetical protein
MTWASGAYGSTPFKKKKTVCPRGHKLVGPNLVKNNSGRRICKACQMAQQWAKRHKKFYDDPIVIARADANYKRYIGETSSNDE